MKNLDVDLERLEIVLRDYVSLKCKGKPFSERMLLLKEIYTLVLPNYNKSNK